MERCWSIKCSGASTSLTMTLQPVLQHLFWSGNVKLWDAGCRTALSQIYEATIFAIHCVSTVGDLHRAVTIWVFSPWSSYLHSVRGQNNTTIRNNKRFIHGRFSSRTLANCLFDGIEMVNRSPRLHHDRRCSSIKLRMQMLANRHGCGTDNHQVNAVWTSVLQLVPQLFLDPILRLKPPTCVRASPQRKATFLIHLVWYQLST